MQSRSTARPSAGAFAAARSALTRSAFVALSCAHAPTSNESGAMIYTPAPPLFDTERRDTSWRHPFVDSPASRAHPWIDVHGIDPTLERATRPFAIPRRPTLRVDSPESTLDAVFALGIGDPLGLRFVRIDRVGDGPSFGWTSQQHTSRWVLRPSGAWSTSDRILGEVDGQDYARRRIEQVDAACRPSDFVDEQGCELLPTVLMLRSLGPRSIEWQRHRAQFDADVAMPAIVDARLRALFAELRRSVARGDGDAIRQVREVAALLAVTSPTSALLAENRGPSAFDVAREWASFALERATRDAATTQQQTDVRSGAERTASAVTDSLERRIQSQLAEAIDCRESSAEVPFPCAPIDELRRLGDDALPILLRAVEREDRVCRACAHDPFGRPPRIAAAVARVVADRLGVALSSRHEIPTWDPPYRARIARVLQDRLRRERAVRRPIRAIDVLSPFDEAARFRSTRPASPR